MIKISNIKKKKMQISIILHLLLFIIFSCRLTDHKLGKDLSINLEDRNVFVSNEKDELFPDTEYFIPPNLITKIEYGITEDQLYKLIGNKYFRERFSFNRVLPKRISYLNYIPIDKMVNFNGGNSTIIRNSNSISYHTSERMTAAFYFYKNRLIYKTIIHTDNIGGKTIFLPLTSKEVLKAQPYTPKSLDTTNEISGMNYWHDAKYYGFVNGYLIENINAEGKKYYSSNVIVGKHLHKKDFFTRNYCMLYAYWEFPDFESDLEKSDYHKFKAKIDLDFEKKTGYWSERVNN